MEELKMMNDLQKLQEIWINYRVNQNTNLSKIDFDELINSTINTKPFYFYIIDFQDMSLSNVSSGIELIHGVEANKVTLKDLLDAIHPDDIDFVTNQDLFITRFFREWLSIEKLMTYKIDYCYNSRVKSGEYVMFNHQGIMLTLDEDSGLGKYLSIHTIIYPPDEQNTCEISFIGLNGEPSYLSMNPEPTTRPIPNFSIREKRILRLIADGLNNSEISEEIFIGVKSIKIQRQIILKKTDCKNIAQLINKCILSKII